MQMLRRFFLAAAILTVLTVSAFGDKRVDNIDVILAVDKSLSMADNQKMESVKRYIDSWLLDEVIIPGDFLVVIAFYGKAEVIVSKIVKDEADKKQIKSLIRGIRGNGRFTDIGNALDVMKEQTEKYSSDGKKKFMLLMTDGKQEAPPSSKYYSPSGTFNHEFLNNTKTIQKTGWKVQILGIGTDTAAKELAKELQGSYGEITQTLTPENLKAQTENLLGSVAISSEPRLAPVGPGGASSLTLTLSSEGYSKEATVSVSGVDVRVGGRNVGNVLKSPRTFAVAPSGKTTVTIPLAFPPGSEPETGRGTLSFSFAAGERFTPSEVPVTVVRQGLVQGIVVVYWWAILAALVLIAAVVLLVVFLVRRRGGGGQLRFTITVDAQPLTGAPQGLRRGGELFLSEVEGVLGTVQKRTARSIARLSATAEGLRLESLKADRFPKLTTPLENVLGTPVVMKAENGKRRELLVLAGAAAPAPEKPAPPETPAEEKKSRAPAQRAKKKPAAAASKKMPPRRTKK